MSDPNRDQGSNTAGLIWSLAELLRGDYKQAEYGRVILPLVVLRRLDQEVVAGGQGNGSMPFSQVLDGATLEEVAARLRDHISGGRDTLREVVDRFEFDRQIDRLVEAGLLGIVIERIAAIDLSPQRVSNLEMGYLFEELIRRFAEQSNETAGEHFTPREVIRLMVSLLVDGDRKIGSSQDSISVYDCACGTGGMLSEAQAHLAGEANIKLYGQELNKESYAICLADMLVKGQDPSRIKLGNTLAEDLHAGEHFDYCIANPPFGVDWSKVGEAVRAEHERGFAGRFGPGLPRKSDGQLLFLLHLISKMQPQAQGGGRIAIVHNGSPLFSGGAGAGESNIRRYLIENDLLEAVIALPEQLFYNTGIASYIWLLSNNKPRERRGKVQLIDSRDLFQRMHRSLGEKRREMTEDHLDAVLSLYTSSTDGVRSRIVRNEEFGYRAVVVERPLRARWIFGMEVWSAVESEAALRRLSQVERAALVSELQALGERQLSHEEDAAEAIRSAVMSALGEASRPIERALISRSMVRDQTAPVQFDRKGKPQSDPALRETLQVPLHESVSEHLAREVLPFAPDAWCQDPEGKIGYEIPFTRIFFEPPVVRKSADVLAELGQLESEIRNLSREVLR